MRTCTVMASCNGLTGQHTYAVMQGPMKNNTFLAHLAVTVATYSLEKHQKPNYKEMTAKHASQQIPAVNWQQ